MTVPSNFGDYFQPKMRGSHDTPKILFELPHRYIVCVCVCVPSCKYFGEQSLNILGALMFGINQISVLLL